jgi:hypothetical protein
MHTSNFAVKFRGMMIALVLLSIIFMGCGPTRQEVAAREAARQEILQLKAQLRKSAQLRNASIGKQIPPRVEDPGYEVRKCGIPGLPQEKGNNRDSYDFMRFL